MALDTPVREYGKHTHRDLSIATPKESGESRLHPVPPKMALPRGVQDAGDAAPQPLSRPRVRDPATLSAEARAFLALAQSPKPSERPTADPWKQVFAASGQ